MRQLLVVDDHPLILDVVRRAFERQEWLVSEATSYAQALERMSNEPKPDLVILDLGLPGKLGLNALRDFRQTFPESPCVVLSGQDERDYVVGAIDLGAMGFISKRSGAEDMLEAISLIEKGYVVTPKHVAPSSPAIAQPKNSIHPMELGLTAKQCEVLAHLVLGKVNKVIARDLALSEATVKTHLRAIFGVLNVKNRTEAVLAASRLGLKLSLFERSKNLG